jgi:hypothetical protein
MAGEGKMFLGSDSLPRVLYNDPAPCPEDNAQGARAKDPQSPDTPEVSF